MKVKLNPEEKEILINKARFSGHSSIAGYVRNRIFKEDDLIVSYKLDKILDEIRSAKPSEVQNE